MLFQEIAMMDMRYLRIIYRPKSTAVIIYEQITEEILDCRTMDQTTKIFQVNNVSILLSKK